MKILFIHDDLFLDYGANSRIVFRLVQYLQNICDAEISLMGRATCEEEYIEEYMGCKLIHEPQIYFDKARTLKLKLGKHLKLLCYILMPRTISYQIHKNENPYIIEARKWLSAHVKEFDLIIATCAPYYPLKLAAEVADKIPVIYYKIDPVATVSIMTELNEDTCLATIDNEITYDSCASKIIMTNTIFKYYKQLPTKVNINKVVCMNYPNIVSRKLSINANNKIVKAFDQNKINICFIGTFYDNVRNPLFLFSLMDKLQDSNIVLHIIGRLGDCEMMFENFLSRSNVKIIYYGIVHPTTADDIMLQADVLVNIGNTSDAYMPSKILDYISSGKPILNICKIPSCPTLPLMARYPLGMTVYEYEDLTENVIANVAKFCYDNKGKQIPFTTISKLYYDSTIEYVGQKFYEVIKSVIKK